MKRIVTLLAIGGLASSCSSTPLETDEYGTAYFGPAATLGYIAHQYNRVNKVQIHVLGASAAQRRYGGALALNDPQTLVSLLRRDPDLDVEQKEDVILVRLRRSKAAFP